MRQSVAREPLPLGLPGGSLPCGAEITGDRVHFRVWAPHAAAVHVLLEEPASRGGDSSAGSQSIGSPPIRPPSAAPTGAGPKRIPLARQADGYFAGAADAGAGTFYRYQLDEETPVPDPWSRFQPYGPHGPSMIVDPRAYVWHDQGWTGLRIENQVIYECHIGAFTREGTFDAAARQLEFLAGLGVTCIELMPIAEFAGAFNWGYDGVSLFAPHHGYGDPEALKRFVDAAHGTGLGVLLDVVYNHLGADGNYLGRFSPDYFTDRYSNEWGAAINFDGPSSTPVRELFVENAAYWIREFHLDGLRLDATQSIFDSSHPHVITQISARARGAAAPRQIVLIAENEPQRTEQLFPLAQGGFELDAMWNDDFHHSARVAATGQRHGYFRDYRGTAQELLSTVKYGFLFQGQYYQWQRKRRGTPALDRPAHAFICALQNHDQVANTFTGQRLHERTSPGRLRALTALLLLGPWTPMLFMGQEFAASSPFTFFADQSGDLAIAIREGRKKFLRQFSHYATPAAQRCLPDPTSPATFERCKLDFGERDSHAGVLALHRDLLSIRRHDEVISRRHELAKIDGAVLSRRALVLRWFDSDAGDRLLLLNLGDDLELAVAPEPLLAPPRERQWQQVWSSDECAYSGPGAVDVTASPVWSLAAESAVLLRAVDGSPQDNDTMTPS